MAFKWAEYLKLADQLSRQTDEASQRTAISRAYYFVFHIARQRAVKNLYRQPEDGTSHDNLWLLYKRNSSTRCKQVATLGKRLKKKRVQADYELYYARERGSGRSLDGCKRVRGPNR
jgi:hypothetical protein